MRIFTIGHSNRSMERFLDVLEAYGIVRVIDVRRFPVSRKFPHFNRENLERVLPEHGIEYFYLGDSLGGFRRGGYKNYTKTKEFKDGLKKLLTLAKNSWTAIMCTEALWFKCHRRYISDESAKLGVEIIHIIDEKRSYRHELRT